MSRGGGGNDEINGYATVTGRSYWPYTGRKTIRGGSGDDFIVGGSDDDRLFGDTGSDTLFGDAGSDALDGGDGDDALYGGVGNDTLLGGKGKDSLFGDAGDDLVDGGEDDDVIVAQSAGGDTLLGGFSSPGALMRLEERVDFVELPNGDLGSSRIAFSFPPLAPNMRNPAEACALAV